MPALPTELPPLIHLDLDMAAFATDWNHCDQVANYLARLASFDRADTFLYSNLLSTVLNELFEIAFVHHQCAGQLGCTLRRAGKIDRIELRIPARVEDRAFLQRIVGEAQADGVGERYRSALLLDQAPDHSVGLLELAADYGARIEFQEISAPGEGVRLIVDVCLEEGPVLQPTLCV